jgi:2-methylisocitrate lyase-like PEP mutase family enzyme
MTAVATVPVVVDADTGYGSEPGVKRSVIELERAGAAAVQIEDQVFPKRCGHMEGKKVIPRDEMVLKLRAALSARRNPDTLVIARTDALQMNGLDDAIDRCNAYAEAGADVTFVDAPRTREHLEEVARKVDGPKLVNMSETGRSPTLTADELQELGFNIVIFPSTQTWLFARVYQELLEELQKTGTSEGLRDRMMPFDEVNDLLGIARWES